MGLRETRNKEDEMKKILDWKAKEAIAKKLTGAELRYAIVDCIDADRAGTGDGYYVDEASVYRKELRNREGK